MAGFTVGRICVAKGVLDGSEVNWTSPIAVFEIGTSGLLHPDNPIIRQVKTSENVFDKVAPDIPVITRGQACEVEMLRIPIVPL